jgi:hypothetical protein
MSIADLARRIGGTEAEGARLRSLLMERGHWGKDTTDVGSDVWAALVSAATHRKRQIWLSTEHGLLHEPD